MPLALFSVSKEFKTQNVAGHARALLEEGDRWEIVATTGTHKFLREELPAYHSRLHTMERIFGVSELLGGVLKTLDMRIHAALIATPQQLKEAHENPENPAYKELYRFIDLLYVCLYPFEQAVKQGGLSRQEIMKSVDLGGVALLRSAFKSDRVVIVPTPEQFLTAQEALNGNTAAREHLASDAMLRVATYDLAIANWGRPPNMQFRLSYNMEV